MVQINKFLFFLGLFSINAFKYNWRAIVIPTGLVGSLVSMYHQSTWHYVPCFIGSYLAGIHTEYMNYKKANDGTE